MMAPTDQIVAINFDRWHIRSLVHQLKIPLIDKLLSFPTQSQKGKELHRVAAISGTIFAAFGIFKRSFLTYLHALLEVK